MKHTFYFLGLFFITSLCIASEHLPASHCLRWKKQCSQKTSCVKRNATRMHACFRCVKHNQYGFGGYRPALQRTTCNPTTARYLAIMKYRCYPFEKLTPCVQYATRECCNLPEQKNY